MINWDCCRPPAYDVSKFKTRYLVYDTKCQIRCRRQCDVEKVLSHGVEALRGTLPNTVHGGIKLTRDSVCSRINDVVGKESSNSKFKQDTANGKHLQYWCMLAEKDAIQEYALIERKMVRGSTLPQHTKVGRIWALTPSVSCLQAMCAKIKKVREDVKHIRDEEEQWNSSIRVQKRRLIPNDDLLNDISHMFPALSQKTLEDSLLNDTKSSIKAIQTFLKVWMLLNVRDSLS